MVDRNPLVWFVTGFFTLGLLAMLPTAPVLVQLFVGGAITQCAILLVWIWCQHEFEYGAHPLLNILFFVGVMGMGMFNVFVFVALGIDAVQWLLAL